MPAGRTGHLFLDLVRGNVDRRGRLAARASLRPARRARGPGAANSGSSTLAHDRDRRLALRLRAPYRQTALTWGWARGSLAIPVKVAPFGTGGDTRSARRRDRERVEPKHDPVVAASSSGSLRSHQASSGAGTVSRACPHGRHSTRRCRTYFCGWAPVPRHHPRCWHQPAVASVRRLDPDRCAQRHCPRRRTGLRIDCISCDRSGLRRL